MRGDFALSDFSQGDFLDGEIVTPWYQGNRAILQLPNPLGEEIDQEESALNFPESHTEQSVFAHRSFQSSCPQPTRNADSHGAPCLPQHESHSASREPIFVYHSSAAATRGASPGPKGLEPSPLLPRMIGQLTTVYSAASLL
jgi:hypothetical protein